MTGKYTPLEHYLRDLPASHQEVTLSFEQIERILNDKLPPSTYGYPAWWANEKEGWYHIPVENAPYKQEKATQTVLEQAEVIAKD